MPSMEFAELLNDKRLQLEFSKQTLWFLDKNKNWIPIHFWSSDS